MANYLGGLELRNEFERAILDTFGSCCTLSLLICPWWCGLTIVFRSRISVGVISDGSTSGSGRFDDFKIWLFPTIEAHWSGRPTYRPSRLSKPVCTRCSKLLGNEICGFFFFFENIFTTLLIYGWIDFDLIYTHIKIQPNYHFFTGKLQAKAIFIEWINVIRSFNCLIINFFIIFKDFNVCKEEFLKQQFHFA